MSRIEKRLLRLVARAAVEFELLEEGDRIMVALSGGKDSFSMLQLLELCRRRVPFSFSLVAVNLDQGEPGFPQATIARWCEEHGFEHHMISRDVRSVVLQKLDPEETPCALCSRLRRGILYDAAVELGCNKLALGHHREDVIETLLLNLFYAGQLKAMAPRLVSDDGRNTVIRPLVYCGEAEIVEYAAEQAFPLVSCGMCASVDRKRAEVKGLLAEMEAREPGVKSSLLAALGNVRATHLLDRGLWERAGLLGRTGLGGREG